MDRLEDPVVFLRGGAMTEIHIIETRDALALHMGVVVVVGVVLVVGEVLHMGVVVGEVVVMNTIDTGIAQYHHLKVGAILVDIKLQV